MTRALLILLLVAASALADMTPEQALCAAPMNKLLEKEKDKDLKDRLVLMLGLVADGKFDEGVTHVKDFSPAQIERLRAEYYVGPCLPFATMLPK